MTTNDERNALEQAVTVAQTELAFWNNGRGHHDPAWVERRAYAMADALRALASAYLAARRVPVAEGEQG